MKPQRLVAGSAAFLVFIASTALGAGNRGEGRGGFAGGSRGGPGGGRQLGGGGGEAMHRTPSMSGGSGPTRGSFNRPSGAGMVPHSGQGQGFANRGFGQEGGNRFASRPNFERPNEGFSNRYGGQGRTGGEGRPNFGNRPGEGGAGERWPGGENRPSFPNRPGQGGSGERWPGGSAERPNFPSRPGQGGSGERWPGGGSAERPTFPNRPGEGGGGERWPGGSAERPNFPSRPGQGGSGERWPGGGSDRPAWPGQGGSGERWSGGRLPRPLEGGGGIGNRTNFGDRTNIGDIGNRTNINTGNQGLNVNNYNTNIASNRNFNGGGNWQQNWNGAHNYWNGNYGWHQGNWSNWYHAPAAWGAAGLATGWLASPLDSYVYSNPFYVAPTASYGAAFTDPGYNYVDYSQAISQPPQVTYNTTAYGPSYDASGGYTYAPNYPPASDGGAYGPASDTTAPLSTASTPPSDESPPPEAFQTFDAARAAFKANDYPKAIREIDRAIKLLPSDVTRHEFRALVLFAEHKYRDAAAGAYAVLSAGPGWTWETVRDFYADPDAYTQQLRALEEYARKHPEASDAHFLLSYHYLVLNYVKQALSQLKQFSDLVPQDKLAPQLIAAFTPPAGGAQASVSGPTGSAEVPAAP